MIYNYYNNQIYPSNIGNFHSITDEKIQFYRVDTKDHLYRAPTE